MKKKRFQKCFCTQKTPSTTTPENCSMFTYHNGQRTQFFIYFFTHFIQSVEKNWHIRSKYTFHFHLFHHYYHQRKVKRKKRHLFFALSPERIFRLKFQQNRLQQQFIYLSSACCVVEEYYWIFACVCVCGWWWWWWWLVPFIDCSSWSIPKW